VGPSGDDLCDHILIDHLADHPVGFGLVCRFDSLFKGRNRVVFQFCRSFVVGVVLGLVEFELCLFKLFL
jgi:hypothetical protein